jgi:protein-S-isoprenylcysteine O-methyltransferase Ste14
LYLLNFVFVALLPRIFFRQGSLNLRWFLTGAPYLVSPAALVAARQGVLSSWIPLDARLHAAAELASVPLAVLSMALIAMTLGTHRIPIALWHQAEDAPRSIVTWGPYARVRHPFYASFLTALLGATVFCPNAGTLLSFAYALIALEMTARREERRLCASEFGAEYAAYMKRTGRFVPHFSARTPEPGGTR